MTSTGTVRDPFTAFEYEDELIEAIVDGMIDRSERGNYEFDRMIINYV